MGRALDLWSIGRGLKSYSGQCCVKKPWASCSHLCASVTKQYNLVPAKGRWCSVAGEVTAGLAESNGSLPPGGWLTVTCRLTACTLGSDPGPTLDIEYGKPLPLALLEVHFLMPTNMTSCLNMTSSSHPVKKSNQRTLANQTKTNNTSNINIREVWHVTVVTDLQPMPDSGRQISVVVDPVV